MSSEDKRQGQVGEGGEEQGDDEGDDKDEHVGGNVSTVSTPGSGGASRVTSQKEEEEGTTQPSTLLDIYLSLTPYLTVSNPSLI